MDLKSTEKLVRGILGGFINAHLIWSRKRHILGFVFFVYLSAISMSHTFMDSRG